MSKFIMGIFYKFIGNLNVYRSFAWAACGACLTRMPLLDISVGSYLLCLVKLFGMASAKKSKYDFSEVSDRIRRATAKRVKLYDSIRGKEPTIPFWDIVVISALDNSQKEAYQIQLEAKQQRNEIPLGVKYHVFHDPPGPKIGNGGSTVVCIDELLKIYGEEKLKTCKIMLAHAGGYSMRMPNATVLGKVFTPLPWGHPPYQMIDMLLAMFIEFPADMIPGILLVCPDTFELFNTDGEKCSFTEPGFTALAHPSPIEIGTTHGVFVLEKNSEDMHEDAVVKTKCSQFLHKPSIEKMRESGVVFQQDDKEHVYTDSIFFVDWNTANQLHQTISKLNIDCEICAFGDFLQSLGPDASVEYTRNVANVTKVSPSLIKTREIIYEKLKGTQLNVIILNESKFYHIGTIAEYMHYFCLDPVFRHEASSRQEVHVSKSGKYSRSPNTVIPQSTILIHCHKNLPSHVGASCVLDCCEIGQGACVEKGCIISNVSIPEDAEVPENVFVMTVCVKVDGEAGLFVTVGYGIEDNMKKTATVEELSKISYVGKPLDEVFSLLGITQSDWDMVSLWHARLFPVFQEQTPSVQYTLEVLRAIREGGKLSLPSESDTVGKKRLSMADVLVSKDVKSTLELREKLREKINSLK